jgi:hypothetical protein
MEGVGRIVDIAFMHVTNLRDSVDQPIQYLPYVETGGPTL